MIQATMPDNEAQKFLEAGLLKIMMVCVKKQMPIEDILKVLERIRHTMTEIKLEIDADERK